MSRKGLKAYLTLLEEFDDYTMKEGDLPEGQELPLPDFEKESMANPEQQALPDKPEDEETPSFNV